LGFSVYVRFDVERLETGSFIAFYFQCILCGFELLQLWFLYTFALCLVTEKTKEKNKKMKVRGGFFFGVL
jgi:hypothetical protein